MDTRRFDAATRALGGAISRRETLAGMAAAIGLGIGGGLAEARLRRRTNRNDGAIRPRITDGQLDGPKHPYVGLMVAQDADGKPLWRCSGTLLSSRVFLTAGHCVETPAAHVEIWFDADVESDISTNGYPYKGDAGGAVSIHPDWDPAQFWLHDLGVVLLDTDWTAPEYGQLPALNQLDSLHPRRGTRNVTFTAVGYGLQKSFPDAASWKEQSQRVRMYAEPKLVQINTGFTGDGSVMLSNNAHTGGTCYGDSGGPNFIGSTRVIGGVTSFAMNGTCAGTGGVYRVDRADDLDWLTDSFGQYLP